MRVRVRLLSLLPVWIVLACALAASAATYLLSDRLVERAMMFKFADHAGNVRALVATRMHSYTDVLVSLQAFVGANGSVSRQAFQSFYDGLNLPARYPGFQFASFARYIRPAQLSAFVASQRGDPVLRGARIPFSVRPPGVRPAYYVITDIAPMSAHLALLGVDIGADPTRLLALERARDSGELFCSGLSSTPGEAGIALSLPVYRQAMPVDTVAQRRLAYVGSVSAVVRVKDLMRGILDDMQLRKLHFRIYDAGPYRDGDRPRGVERLLFDSWSLLPAGARLATDGHWLRQRMPMTFGGRLWVIDFSAQARALEGSDRYIPAAVLGGGMLISVLLAVLTYVLSHSRERAVALAGQMTHNLRRSELALAEAQRVAHLGSWRYDVSDGSFQYSDEMGRLLGRKSRAGAGMGTLDDLLGAIAPEHRTLLRARIDAALHDRQGFELACRYRVATGRVGWLSLIGRPPTASDPLVLRGTAMEITQRKQAEQGYQLEHAIALKLGTASVDDDIVTPVLEAICAGMCWDAATFRPTPAGRAQGMPDGRFTTMPQRAQWLGRTPPVSDDAARAPLPGPQWCNRRADLAKLPHAHWLELAEVATILSIPLRLESTLLGVMEFYSHRRLRTDRAALNMASSLVNQMEQFMRRRRAEQDLRYVATHDVLTGLPNRLLFNDTLQAVLADARSDPRPFHLMFVDVDQFKQINDTLGHDAGDALLKSCAERLRGELGHARMLARLGGDEFIVVLAEQPGAPSLLDTLRAVQAVFAAPVTIGGAEMKVTVSIGVSTYPQHGTDASTLLKHADIAMYRAKERGRNNFQFYAQPMGASIQRAVSLESHLWHALANRELALHYQPRLSLRTGQISGVEALLRWHHPTHGMLRPQQFIPIAEKSGLIVPIGAWVLREACRQNAAWRKQGLPESRVAVNLSARQFIDNDLAQDVMLALDEAGLPPTALELELTETLMMQQPEQVSQVLAQLKAKGVAISVDDFGTGYSSLGYLKRFPIDAVKIDGAFIKNIPKNQSDMQITTSVIALAHGLHLGVIAEGVECEAQVAFLRAHDCDEIQGFYFSKPLPADAMARFLAYGENAAPSSSLG